MTRRAACQAVRRIILCSRFDPRKDHHSGASQRAVFLKGIIPTDFL